MKIKYKLISIFILIIIISSFPLALFILHQQEKEKESMIINRGLIDSRILSHTILNILLRNEANIRATRIEANEMIEIMKPLTREGLIYADVITLTKRKEYDGIILAQFIKNSKDRQRVPKYRLPKKDIDQLKSHPGIKKRYINEFQDDCYEFIAKVKIFEKSKESYCVGRLIFSKKIVFAKIDRLRVVTYIITLLAIFVVSIVGLFFSRMFSKPIDELIDGVEKIGVGDFEYKIPVRSSDEMGRLATTFNHLAEIIKLEIIELVNTNKELKRLDNLKDEFLANISHELRTPLYGIIGIAESLSDGLIKKPDKRVKGNLNMIIGSGKRLTHLVNDILDFSKLKHHDIELKLSAINLHTISQLVISIMQPVAAKKNLKINNTIPQSFHLIKGDEDRVQQILFNLLGNAVKFTEKGSITLAVTPDEHQKNAIISVSDTGIGIDPEKQDRIFEVFEQADGSIERKFGGSGLGLAITRQLVELHGGSIWVESSQGQGASFYLSLPLLAEGENINMLKNQNSPQNVYEGQVDLTVDDIQFIKARKKIKGTEKNTILIVDDEPVNLQVLINHLALEGYKLIAATNGREALDRINDTSKPDLVILDVMLPEMSGYEVCRHIRKAHSSYDLPVLMLTAKNKPDDIVTGLEAGANDYLTKPVNKMELLARVNSLITLKNAVRLHNELHIIKRDLHIAHEIQNSILSRELPQLQSVNMAVKYEAMTKLGGDFYDIQMLDEKRLGIIIADVSGHGIPAAFICVMLKVVYSFHIKEKMDPAELFDKINSTMYEFCGGQFITACFICIDLDKKQLTQVSAGHWPPLIIGKSDSELRFKKKNGIPFGWMEKYKYESVTMDIHPNERIVLYTDGLIEARNKKEIMFGEERFFNLIKDFTDKSPEEFISNTIKSIRNWSEMEKNEAFDDDITLITIDIHDVS